MPVLQVPEADSRVVELVGTDRARVAEHELMHLGVGVDSHVRDRKGIVPVLVRVAVPERPRRRAMREVQSVGDLIGIDLPRFVVHEVDAGYLLRG